jgi:hypothetical protein
MCNFWEILFTAIIMPIFFVLTSFNCLWHFWANISLHFFFFRNMSSGSSQRKVRQMTKEGIAATRDCMENRQVIPKRNIVRADIMVAALDFIVEMIQANHWGYLFSCACPVYPWLVRDFYRYMQVVQDGDSGIILQTTIRGHIIRIDRRLINSIIDVPILAISASPFSEVLERDGDRELGTQARFPAGLTKTKQRGRAGGARDPVRPDG